jgi:hypothetical protein
VDIISIAQQANPKPKGQREFALAQLVSSSTDVKITSPSPDFILSAASNESKFMRIFH